MIEDPLEDPPQDEQLGGNATSLPTHGPASRTAPRHLPEDGVLLGHLAECDESLRERGAAWKDLARRLDGLRREIAVTSAEAQRSRSLAARKASRDGEGDAGPSGPTREEVRATRLTQEFEAALRRTEERRVELHAEMDDIRRRRQSLLGRLPAPLSRAYQSLAGAGRLPAVAAVAKGACGACGSPLPESVIEALSHGAVAVCTRCERLLRPSEGGK